MGGVESGNSRIPGVESPGAPRVVCAASLEDYMRRHFPGFAQIANLGISTKLGLIVAVLAIPILALLFVQFQDRQSATGQADNEADGLDYVGAIVPFMREVQLHRGLVERVLNGDEGSRANMERTAASAETAFAAIQEMDKKYGKEFGTNELVKFIGDEWARAKAATSSSTESNQLHSSVIQQGVFPLITTVATESELVLDPDLDNRNVIVALTETLPQLTEALSQLRGNGAAAMAARANLPATDAQRQFLSGQMTLANFLSGQLTAQLETAMANNDRFETDLRPIVSRSNTSRDSFFDSTRDSIINASSISQTGAEGYFLLGGSSIDHSNQLLVSATEALKADFDARADSARADFSTYGSAGLIGIVIALGLAIFISATITRPMTHLAEVADRMSLGELDVDIDVEGDNEIGQLAESLRRMQSSLRSAIERLRQRRTAA
jgi:methyl-accepting chemotaxis protein